MIEEAKTKIGNYTVYVTIQFGHNDQKVTSGVNVTEYGSNLERFGREVQQVGGIAVSVLCLLSFVFFCPDDLDGFFDACLFEMYD